MLRVRRTAIGFSILMIGLAGCERTPTQLVVSVDTDIEREHIESITLFVGAATSTPNRTLRASEISLPFSFGVVPLDGDASRRAQIRVVAKLLDGTSVERLARIPFIEEKRMGVSMFLLKSCIAAQCPMESTCTDTGCRSVDVQTGELYPVPSGAPPRGIDAEAPGSGPDASGPDGSGPDASIQDVGMDATATDGAQLDGTDGIDAVAAPDAPFELDAGTQLDGSIGCRGLCRGDCVDGTCILTGDSTCPTGIPCEIQCSPGGLCNADCDDASACTVVCMGNGSCGTVRCGNAFPCAVRCIDNLACGSVTCGPGYCSVDCELPDSCNFVNCQKACDCAIPGESPQTVVCPSMCRTCTNPDATCTVAC